MRQQTILGIILVIGSLTALGLGVEWEFAAILSGAVGLAVGTTIRSTTALRG